MKTITALVSSVCLFAAGSAIATDTQAPVVQSVSITPSAVDVSTAPAVLHITMHVTDDESGMQYGNVYLYNPAGNFVVSGFFTADQRTSGTAVDGMYTFDVEVPRYVAPGTWRLDALMLDFLDHQRNIGVGGAEPFPVPADATFTVANTGTIDSTAPELLSYGYSQDTIYTGNGAVPVEFTFESKDPIAGFSYGYLLVHDPNGAYHDEMLVFAGSNQRVSGTSQQGTYQVVLTFPQGSLPGNWTVDLYQTDLAGNNVFSPVGHVTVADTVDASATIGRAVEAMQFPWTTGASPWNYQTATSHDGVDAAASGPVADSGSSILTTMVTGPGTLSFQWRVDSEVDADFLSVAVDVDGEVLQISGNTSWASQSVTIPEGSHTVTWKYEKDASDTTGADRGWIDEVRFTAEADTAAPLLQDLRIAPRIINVNHGDKSVTFIVEISDELNGFEEGTLDLLTPSGATFDSIPFSATERSGGDGFLGTYQITAIIPSDAELGTWHARVSLTDSIDFHTRIYGPGESAYPTAGQEEITVTDGTGDVQAPYARSVAVSPSTTDVSGGPSTVTVTLHVTDNLAGFSIGNVAVYSANGDWTGSTYFTAAERISGDESDGIYQIEVPVPRYGPPGTWRVGCWLMDGKENQREYPYDLELPVPADAEFAVTNSGPVDMTPPAVTSIDITPASVDATATATQVTVNVSIADDLSGLREAYLFIFRPGNYDSNVSSAVLDASNRVSGDAVTGSYQVQVPIAQGSTGGAWLVRVYIRDMTGRSQYYGPNAAAYPETGDGFFTVIGPAASLYQNFLDAHHLTGGDALPSADPDHDGINNATELLLGGNPTDPSSNGGGSLQLSRDSSAIHLDLTLASSLSASTSGNRLAISDGGGGAPVLITGQTQNGLGGAWTDALPTHLSGQTYRVTLPLSSGTSGFIRLATEAP